MARSATSSSPPRSASCVMVVVLLAAIAVSSRGPRDGALHAWRQPRQLSADGAGRRGDLLRRRRGRAASLGSTTCAQHLWRIPRRRSHGAARRGHGAAVGVDLSLRRRRRALRHRRRRRDAERAARPGGDADLSQAALEGRRALLLPAQLPHQDRRRPGQHDAPLVRGARDRRCSRSAAPSTAASATTRCARELLATSAEDFQRWFARAAADSALRRDTGPPATAPDADGWDWES